MDLNGKVNLGDGKDHSDTGRSRRRKGALAGLAMLLLVAVPAGWCAFLAIVSFTGCLIECGEPQPAPGAMWAALTAALLSLPLITGLAVSRVPLRRLWPWLIGLVGAVALGALLAQRVI
ncbi:hypothetical protein SacmaDRAFT_5607 [Saccharomonospora marina XMU15]|uniref:Transmembrane protein n=1 Tax=Saccharomonospora marina XMU15 TaxID=882083 RepID=H5XA63_9PSEU|nr:hypothetical protein [Saccharomonospora marina]EHR53723.1 hypothetical protein SacmaDRAFT_5607 [Saccharomonospora marina XMU15]